MIAFLFSTVAFGASTFTSNYNLEKPADGDTVWAPTARPSVTISPDRTVTV